MTKHEKDPRLLALSPNAQRVGASLFGMMAPGGESRLRLAGVKSKPTPDTQAALDEIVASGLASLTVDGRERTYRPTVSFHPLMAERMLEALQGGSDHSQALFEPI